MRVIIQTIVVIIVAVGPVMFSQIPGSILSKHRSEFSLHGSQCVGELVEIPVAVDSSQRLFGVCQVGLGYLQAANRADHGRHINSL